ncbi:MAG: nucleotide sugar dehydrogenase, partial [Elioraea sp.]|nr:nucleotide sugar dehydrogenase [Elioraea sp.]
MDGRLSRVCVLGLGYVGLPAAAMLASHGFEVIGCDIDPRVVARVNEGKPHFREPDLDMLLAAAVQTGRLRAQAEPAEAEAFLIAVPTPFGPDRAPDLSHVEAATAAIAPLLRPGDLVVLESTVPVGTTERIAAQLAAARPDLAFPRYGETPPPGAVHLAHCPERVLPGAILRELAANDRVVGGLSQACGARARALYERFVTGDIHLTDCRTAELVKLAENAFRDVNIAFANELAAICDRIGVDVWRAIRLANCHPRVAILRP